MRFLDYDSDEQQALAEDARNYSFEDPRYFWMRHAPNAKIIEYMKKANPPYDEDEDDWESWEDSNVPPYDDKDTGKVLSWEELSPPSKYGLKGSSPYYKYNMDTGILGGWLTEDELTERQSAIDYLAAIAKKYGTNALIRRLYADDAFDDDLSEYTGGLSGMLGPDEITRVLQAVYKKNTADTADVNGDGDTDIIEQDTDGNGHIDTATVVGDTLDETAKGVKKAAKDLAESPDAESDEITSTGKTKNELKSESKPTDTTSDARQKRIQHMVSSWGKTATQKKREAAETASDIRQKNILAALRDRLY